MPAFWLRRLGDECRREFRRQALRCRRGAQPRQRELDDERAEAWSNATTTTSPGSMPAPRSRRAAASTIASNSPRVTCRPDGREIATREVRPASVPDQSRERFFVMPFDSWRRPDRTRARVPEENDAADTRRSLRGGRAG